MSHTAPAVPSVVLPTQMRIGRRFQISQNVEGYKIELPSETIVSRNTPSVCGPANRALGKKLKRRLEDLERRAGSSSASPPSSHAELQASRPDIQLFNKSPNATQRQSSPRIVPSQFTPPMEDNEIIFAQNFNNRDGSRTPPLFAYSAYPAPEEVVYPPFSQQTYQPMVSSSEYNDFLQPIPVSLPSMMHFHEAIKREDEQTMSPYNMYNQGLPSIDYINQRPYEDMSHPHVSRILPPARNVRTVPNGYL